MTLHIVSLIPALLNTNGDAENANVLAARARWAGIETEVFEINDVSHLPDRVDAVVIGSGSDSDLDAARAALLPAIDRIRAWATERVALLAIGSGWELLSWGLERDNGQVVEGFGVFAGRAVRAPERVVGDLVVQSPWGELVGFENHARDYVGAEKSSIGAVVHGSGNGIVQPSGRRHEGVVMGTAVGTHMHGPICAKNPAFADAMLENAAKHAGLSYERSTHADEVDRWAAAATARIVESLDPQRAR